MVLGGFSAQNIQGVPANSYENFMKIVKHGIRMASSGTSHTALAFFVGEGVSEIARSP